VAELGAAGEIGRPVSRVHVADGNQVPGTRKSQKPPQPASDTADRDAPVHLGEGPSRRLNDFGHSKIIVANSQKSQRRGGLRTKKNGGRVESAAVFFTLLVALRVYDRL